MHVSIVLPIIPVYFFFQHGNDRLRCDNFYEVILVSVLGVETGNCSNVSGRVVQGPHAIQAIMLVVFIRLRAGISVLAFLKGSSNGYLVEVRRFFRSKGDVCVRRFYARLIGERVGKDDAQGPIPIRSIFLPTAHYGNCSFSQLDDRRLRTTVARMSSMRVNVRMVLNVPWMA